MTPMIVYGDAVEPHRLADDLWIAAELRLPQAVAEDEHAAPVAESAGANARPANAETPSTWKKSGVARVTLEPARLADADEIHRVVGERAPCRSNDVAIAFQSR